jgi:hypothetical protein
MNRLVAFLIVLIVVLVAALMFLLGRTSADTESPQIAKIDTPPTAATRPVAKKTEVVQNSVPDTLVRPVKIGGDEMLDACGGNSIVVGLNPRGDNFLAVKAGPSLNAKRIDKLGPNTEVYLCEQTADGAWSGIVYDGSGKWTARCGVTSAVATRRSYTGPCQSGWVSSKYLELIAG